MGFTILMIVLGGIVVILLGFILLVARAHKKVPQGKALIRTGFGGAKVALDSGIFVIPILHKVEEMDISLKTIEVERAGSEGLICKDNMRADIKVVFFVRVNKDEKYVVEVAQTIGCSRASEQATLNSLFDAKFSEALKTVGKGFDFVDLYTEREEFKKGILKTIGTDLNGYILDDCAIDYLEQTSLSDLDQKNILDAQGIKKIEELTSIEQERTNQIRRNREQTIKEQDVETRKNILRLEKQQIEEEQKQKREIAELTTEQENAAKQVMINKNLETELIQKQSEQKLGEAEEDKQRQIILARLNKEELEKVQQQLVETEEQKAIENREKVVGIAKIEKEKILEENKRDIQVIIKERKAEEKKTVEEDQKIEDVKQLAAAERARKVAEIEASKEAEMQKILQTRKAEADKLSAEVKAQQVVIEADAKKAASQKEAEARKINAEALAAEEATVGLAEADVMKAKAEAKEMEGTTEANILQKKAEAESKAIQLKAEAERVKGLAEAEVIKEKGQIDATVTEQKGLAEAKIIEQKLSSEAKGIEAKANAMKLLDGVGKEHEEFKLKLEQEKAIKLAEIQAQLGIAESQARVLASALQQAKIDIVGGETKFFDSIINAINKGKSIDRMIGNSDNLQAIKGALLGSGDDNLIARVSSFVEHYGISTESVKNLTLSALLSKIYAKASGDDKDVVMGLIETVSRLGMGGEEASKLLK
ncbi:MULTISPECIES: SPFH domain-containing protein [unclassified Aureispira]|uniref:SPFH domain-containing protein n=1 Tax=unclassified Aureispira TaxID=2649989 RepID=UPI000696E854|nr:MULTISPECIES: SPFH domain-containing protein [unclassified Aureispira]WMX17417.1 flotillin family protein [Aureispira sp. CCB-E]